MVCRQLQVDCSVVVHMVYMGMWQVVVHMQDKQVQIVVFHHLSSFYRVAIW